jgi:leucyl aminopeptidase
MTVTVKSVPQGFLGATVVVCFSGDVGRLPADLRSAAEAATASDTAGESRRVVIHTGGKAGAAWLIVVFPGKTGLPRDAEGWMAAVAGTMAGIRDTGSKTAVFLLPAEIVTRFGATRAVELTAVASRLAVYEFRPHKTKGEGRSVLTSFDILLDDAKPKPVIRAAETAGIIADAVRLARDLVNEPSSVMTPDRLASVAETIAAGETGVTCQVMGPTQLKREGMGAMLGIAQGSDIEPRFIKLSYKGRSKKTILLIGKGITFDSGGISLKPTGHIETMKCDMAGAATILGIFSVLAKLSPAVNVVGLIAATENMPSGHAVKPGDIVTAMNGMTIEILNTDAEGRVVLADAISYAARHVKADEMIDLATLTGACVVALGEEIAGIFSNNDALAAALLSEAADWGEPLWRLPLADQYKDELKSNVADVSNVGKSRYGGAINGALFLKEFVPDDTTWAHLDIAGPAFAEKDTPLCPYGGTGYGVRTLIAHILSAA